MSVAFHLLYSKGLFHAAISESNPMGVPLKSPAQARAYLEQVVARRARDLERVARDRELFHVQAACRDAREAGT